MLAACSDQKRPHGEAPPIVQPPRDAAPPDAAATWPELASLPRATGVRTVALPAKSDTPRFETVGPVLAGDDLAIVGSSQFGFAAIDLAAAKLAWVKPAGLHVAPPIVGDASVYLIGDCVSPPAVTDKLYGCLRTVTKAGADESYVAIHGSGAFDEPGTSRTWLDGDRLVWRRGEQTLAIDPLTGAATPWKPPPPPLHVVYKDRAWDVTFEDRKIIARTGGKLAWQTERRYDAFVGAVYLDGQAPMLRVASTSRFGGEADVNVFDVDATGSLHGTVAFPVPGVEVVASGIDAAGDATLAIALDERRTYLVGFAATAAILWAYPLPAIPRADPIGIAATQAAVVAFHDGDTVTILPAPLANAAAPGAPLQKPAP